MFTKNIFFKNFKKNKYSKKIKLNLNKILNQKSELIKSFSLSYADNYNINKIKALNKKYDLRIIGMGGSILGARAIYDFFRERIKKKTYFIDDLSYLPNKAKKKRFFNLIISKSGNTLETIANSNILINKKDKNLFITENRNSYLFSLAQKLKSEIIHHNNFIGGRYSVLSEVGMLPAELMGLKPKKFRQMNDLIKNKNFLNSLVRNVNTLISLSKKKKFNSVILNYDPKLINFLEWYKQLTAESLGKKGKGFLPVISNMPKDNHSVMQLYLDGFKKNFFTFFFTHEKKTTAIKSKILFKTHKFMRKKTINEIKFYQKNATENVFNVKNIPFRSFDILSRNEETLGELFIFFMLEVILLGKFINVNPFDQPSVELIKRETLKQFK